MYIYKVYKNIFTSNIQIQNAKSEESFLLRYAVTRVGHNYGREEKNAKSINIQKKE